MGATIHRDGEDPWETTYGAHTRRREAQRKYWGFRLPRKLQVTLLDLCLNMKGRYVCACDTRTHRYGYAKMHRV